MNIMTNCVAWHIKNDKEVSTISKRFSEYSIPFSIDEGRSIIPKHKAVLVSNMHSRKAAQVLLRFFGRRSGVDIM
jgi:hypothetical protein